MIEFWLAVGLLLLVGTAFLLVPVLRGRRAQAEEDRTALNVALYQERLAELTTQREAGTLTVELAGEWLYIHWVTVEATDIEAATAGIVSGFERYLEVMYG